MGTPITFRVRVRVRIRVRIRVRLRLKVRVRVSFKRLKCRKFIIIVNLE